MMKKYILLLLLLLGISLKSYSQTVENLGVIASNDFYYSNSYLQTTQTTFIYEFTVSGMRGIHFDFCSSKGLSGTKVWLLDRTTNFEQEITEKCTNNGLVSQSLNLSGAYVLTVNIVSQLAKWDFDINLYSMPALSERTDKPIDLGTLYENRKAWYNEHNTMDFMPDTGSGGAIRYKFRTLCSTRIDFSTDAQNVIFRTENGSIIKKYESSSDIYGMGESLTLEKGVYTLSLDYKNGREDNFVIEFYIYLLEDLGLGKDSLRTSFTPVKSSLTRLPGDHNYIYSRKMQSADENKYVDVLTLFDGLGRMSVTAFKDYDSMGNNLLFRQQYDENGREWRQWLPISIKKTLYPNMDIWKSSADSIYEGDSRPFSENSYKCDGLNRLTSIQGAGDAWEGHRQQVDYLVNTIEDGMLQCSYYYIDNFGQLEAIRVLPAGQLSIVKGTDEDEKCRLTFIDNQGRTILERQINGKIYSDTYYVYDGTGNLRYVFPPEYSNPISSTLTKYAYCYTYDYRNRCIEKSIPGCQPIKYVYDEADRLIFMQDGNMASKNEWKFTIFDKLGRETVQGICKSETVPVLKGKYVTAHPSEEKNGGFLSTGYDVESFEYLPTDILKVCYYDNYSFIDKEELNFSFSDKATSERYDSQYISKAHESLSAKGRLTGVKRWLDAGYSVTDAYYYDAKGMLVQKRTENLISDFDVEYYAYSFDGRLLNKKLEYNCKGLTEQYTYEYDALGRLLMTIHQLDNNTPVVLSENYYDALGRLSKKQLHNRSINTNFEYNIRGWLTGIDCPSFQQKIYYVDGKNTPFYNGNISSMTWRSDTITRGYCYNYDGLNRVLKAEYGEGDSLNLNTGRFNEQVIGYDKESNILALKRFGRIGYDAYGLVDDLLYCYNDNKQLARISDTSIHSAYGNGFEFRDVVSQSSEYTYDGNGNLTRDLNKGISEIKYNYLNLPTKIIFDDGACIQNNFDVDGRKIISAHEDAGGSLVDIYYDGNAIYEQGILKMLLTDEGYITFDQDTVYHYFIRDYQGNNRETVRYDGIVEESNNYYPFGGVYNSLSIQPYKYSGKELVSQFGLNWYDYGARMYDPTLGRWHVVDPLAEDYYSISKYAFCGSNPINRVDPFGMDYWSTSDPNEIARFMDAISFNNSSIFESFDFSSWNHITDDDFVGNLTFNDETNTFYTSYGVVENGIPTSVGVSVKAFNVWDGGAAIDGGKGRWYRRASGKLENKYPEFNLFFGSTTSGWSFFKNMITSLFRPFSTMNTFDANKSGFAQGGSNREKMGKAKGNMSGNRGVQKEQVESLCSKYHLEKAERRTLHDLISGQGYGYHEVEQLIKDYFNK